MNCEFGDYTSQSSLKLPQTVQVYIEDIKVK